MPKQENDYDCGVFILMYVRCVILGLPFPRTTEGMEGFRLQMAEEFHAKKLIRTTSTVDRLEADVGKTQKTMNDTPAGKQKRPVREPSYLCSFIYLFSNSIRF
jgi:Ulp1 protease family, C-terminal catalytic domain